MAEGYAKATGKVGVVLVTSGPGATNTVTGIATAYFESIATVVMTGKLPTSLIGILAGVTLLVNLPREPLLTGLAVFVLFFALRYLFNIHGERRISRLWALPAGFAGGLISALFGTGGPPYVIYLSHRTTDRSALRASFSGLFMLDGALRIVAFLATGLLASGLLTSIALSIPVMAAGLYFGNKVHLGISNQQTLSLIGALLLVSGASLLWKVWG